MKELRPYQRDTIDTSLRRLGEGLSKQMVILPTGGGKTYTAVKLTEKAQFKSILWCTDTEELAEQSALAFIREKFDETFCQKIVDFGFIDYVRKGGSFNGFKIGLIKADVFEPTGNLVVASLQTLHRRLDKLDPYQYDCVIIDECHIACANSFQKSIRFFQPTLLQGLTATGTRLDGMSLGDIFDEIVYEYPLLNAIQDGYLVELDAVKIKTNVNLDSVKTMAGDLNEKQLSNEINTLARNNLIADSYLKYTPNQKALGFAVDIRHALDLAEAFNEKGIAADAVSSNEALTGDRSQKIQDFKDGKIQVLFNVNIMTKGVDIPEISTIIMARPTKSLTLYMQAIGRGTRTLTGTIDHLGNGSPIERIKAIKGSNKTKCTILDVVDNTTKHNLVNAWTLDKDLPPEERVFITQEKRDKLIEARLKKAAEITHKQEKDERIDLIKIPKVKLNKSIRMQEEATEAQLRWVYDLGYPDDVHYTKAHCNEIINNLPATFSQIKWANWKKYDVGSVAVFTRGMFNACFLDAQKREKVKPSK